MSAKYSSFNMFSDEARLECEKLIQNTRIPEAGTGANTASQDIISMDISPKTVAFQGNSVPGYLTVRLKTAVPTKGEITVSGNSKNAKILISESEYKTEHIINWVPFMEEVGQPLPPGQYTMKLNLYRQDGSSTLGIPAGDFVVVHESNPMPAIDNIKVSPIVVTQMPEPNGTALTISFRVNRHVEVSYVLRSFYKSYDTMWPVKLTPGLYSWSWNGRNRDGELIDYGEYRVCFRGYELNFNDPKKRDFDNICSSKLIFDPPRIPESRFREIVKEITLETPSITPDGDGVEDLVTGSVTLNENADIGLRIADGVGSLVAVVLTEGLKEPGSYKFTWDGKDIQGNIVPNGNYYIMAYLIENKQSEIMIYKDKYIRVKNSTEIKPMLPIQNVRIIADYTWVGLKMAGTYLALKGETYPIIDFAPMYAGGSYQVLLSEGVYGNVKVEDVEWLELDKVPSKWGRAANAPAEIRSSKSTESAVLGYVQQGNTIRILNKEGDWYRVVMDSGKQGYTKAANLVEVASPEPQPPVTPDKIEHVVVSGDVLWKIAQKYGVSVNDIISANNLNPNGYLTIGQKLLIPKKAPVLPGTPAYPKIYYTLPGDSFWKISQAYGITLQDLYKANRLTASSPLWVNQRLVIPGVYYVISGDTLWKIAQKHKATIDKIIQINGLDIKSPLYIGQRLLIGI